MKNYEKLPKRKYSIVSHNCPNFSLSKLNIKIIIFVHLFIFIFPDILNILYRILTLHKLFFFTDLDY